MGKSLRTSRLEFNCFGSIIIFKSVMYTQLFKYWNTGNAVTITA